MLRENEFVCVKTNSKKTFLSSQIPGYLWLKQQLLSCE